MTDLLLLLLVVNAVAVWPWSAEGFVARNVLRRDGRPAVADARRPSAGRASPLYMGSAVLDGDKVNGKSVKDWTVERTMFQALHMATAEEMERDPTVCLIGEDVGHYGGSYKVSKDLHYRFGNFQVMDTPIVENTFTGMAIGAAATGLRPIVEGMNMGFLLLAYNQIANNAGMMRYTSGGQYDIPVVIRGPGGIGKQLGPEHSQRLEAYLNAVPGLKLVACSTPRNARGLLKAAIRDNNPVVFFEHVLLYNLKEEIPYLPYTQAIDKAELVKEGKDLTVLCYSRQRHVAVEAAKRLEKTGLSLEIIDLISLKPLDVEAIKKSISKTHRCIILEESSKAGGVGADILSCVIENCSDTLADVPTRVGAKDIPTPYNAKLEEATVPSVEDVMAQVMWMMTPHMVAKR
ncbi:unnamed protein product [Vitrella brassicaformis CCMP3155]|uniref:Transketolase-like pyrimidine-binding domain-containing protein n=1 Tax=Vitrella brassicaformis (strain CCMP3155) TaxID=1169540 RepID=A0A0G4EVX8_VITBC|nr:unnamed protein product [Vitrella brassicaformis CCMP3155]|eukprot:CEM02587.1 unnamed protein product [Vitrella brassicaformis CCMP3155]